ncbi:glycoside hydrolase family 2 protein [Chitinophaga sp. Cy-1792]|uniref:glycoside hydrolase family 2 protein n=1 Tax=Chitinophaga sp. Cy-1792 TaxID=2608339 RepID=UPI00141E9236|nr:sugar-binding domain-containing protein [Chitinophaga sp. Cy-1792]
MSKRSRIIGFLCPLMLTSIVSFGQQADREVQASNLVTPWGEKARTEKDMDYPRPGLKRDNWVNLDGKWNFTVRSGKGTTEQGTIQVPFPIESKLSGVQKKLFPDDVLVYERNVTIPNKLKNHRVMLHFDAVDWDSKVFVNDQAVGDHKGGYTRFSFDITKYLNANGANKIRVEVKDPSDQGINPHGKQTLNPGSIYYTPSSGIWQTVWMEEVPEHYITGVNFTPDIDNNQILVKVDINEAAQPFKINIKDAAGKVVASGEYKTGVDNKIAIKNPQLWTPDNPNLYTAELQLLNGKQVVDKASSYFGMRKISLGKDSKGFTRIMLNNKPVFNLGVLDQGFWPDGLMTPPSDEAMEADIKSIKAMGFNTIRKHIKVEPERWYYYTDKNGMLVWQDFVNPPHGLPEGAKAEFEKESKAIMEQLYNHPSIVVWVLFNERWGAYDQERLTKWVKQSDPTRLVNGHSGELLYVNNQLRAPSDNPWVNSDITDVHTYPAPMTVPDLPGKAKVIGEFGGINVSVPYHQWDDIKSWGYATQKATDFPQVYRGFVGRLKQLEDSGLSASIYTQPFDVETEENGLLTYDRKVLKINLDSIRAINAILNPTANNSKLNPPFNLAANLDVHDDDSRYNAYINDFKNGKKDSAFVRRMILMSMRQKDNTNANLLTDQYIKSLKAPTSTDNLRFIANAAMVPGNPGYAYLMENRSKLSGSAADMLSGLTKKKIEAEYITPALPNITSAKWDEISAAVAKEYGSKMGTFVDGRALLYYWQHKDWPLFGKYYRKYYEANLEHSEYHINNITWEVFVNCKDEDLLKFATTVAKFNVEQRDSSQESMDTYANLLYRTGNKDEAIKWERKAVAVSGNKELVETLRKMEAGQPTWPESKN